MSFIQNVNSLMSREMLIDFLSLLPELHEKGIDDVIDIFATILKLPITKYPEGFLRELVPTFEEIDPPREFLVHVPTARIVEIQTGIANWELRSKWPQKGARFPAANQYPEIETFLHSYQKATITRRVFKTVRSAKDFAMNYFNRIEDCLKFGYSATATVSGSSNKRRVRIVKTAHVQAEKLKSLKQELNELISKLTNIDVGAALPLPSPADLTEDEAEEESEDLGTESTSSFRMITRKGCMI